MRGVMLLLLACVAAAVVPCWSPSPLRPAGGAFPGWPAAFEGAPLRALPGIAHEQQFAREFPGRIGRFTDGRREVIIRWVAMETRMLHPARDCFRGLGYAVEPGPLYRDADHRSWSTFAARKGTERLCVRELIVDDVGRSWSDVSAWYWAAAFQKTHGPWWAYTLAERDTDGAQQENANP